MHPMAQFDRFYNAHDTIKYDVYNIYLGWFHAAVLVWKHFVFVKSILFNHNVLGLNNEVTAIHITKL